MKAPKYPGKQVTTNGNQIVASTEAMLSDCGVFYPITPSTEQGEAFEMSVSQGTLTVFGDTVKAIETEGEHAAQGGAIAISTTGKRVSNFTSGQGIVYGLEQYYHAPGKLSTMVLNVGARALTKHALNVHCGHDDIMAALDTGWIMLMAKDAQQAVDQTLILRHVTEKSLTPGMNIQDGFLTTHLQRTFLEPEPELIREFLGHPNDTIPTPTEAQKELFGPTRRRVPKMYDLQNPILLGSVQNQEHYMTGVISRRQAFNDPILGMLEQAYKDYAELTGREYGLVSEYNTKNSDTVFLSLGSSAENIEAACDYIKDKYGENVGVIHLNVIRPFPEAAIIKAIKGKKNLIVLERTDEPNSGSNPIVRDIRTAISKALENQKNGKKDGIGTLTLEETPRVFEGVYGLGSRDFRPEGILGAYEFVSGKGARQDGKKAADGENFFYIGVNHPYAVISEDTPSLLPKGAIAVRIHSIGGWGAITTGKNMAEILGGLSPVSKFSKNPEDQVIHISANPKYGSEKKGAPTNYFLVQAPERIRVNCDLKHVDVVLCCDPKAFTHSNPLKGLSPGGAFVWESSGNPEQLWKRIPKRFRKEIIEKEIKMYSLGGFEIARSHTPREDLQTRMQGNAFLGAFFKVSPFLQYHEISQEQFLESVLSQYRKKFGKLGDAVVEANMDVMKAGFEGVNEIALGDVEDKDESGMLGEVVTPFKAACVDCGATANYDVAPIYSFENYKKEFLDIDIDNQPASALTSTGIIPAATGARNSKFVSRIKTPVYNPYNCTQCMACVAICPDTALPNTAQDISQVVMTLFNDYVSDSAERKTLLQQVVPISENVRAKMKAELEKKSESVAKFQDLLMEELGNISGLSDKTKSEISKIAYKLPLGYGSAKPIFQMMEKKNPGAGGLFSIFVNDLCKGCGECIVACGSHEALTMVEETEEIRGDHMTAIQFLNKLPQTPEKFLGKFDPEDVEGSRAAVLNNHLMVQKNYNAFVAGDGACAGCGEKSVLRGVVTATEALMRSVFDKKVARLSELVSQLESEGAAALEKIKSQSMENYENLRLSMAHLILGKGAQDVEASKKRIAEEFKGSDKDLIDALVLVLKTDMENHKVLKRVEGKYEGMAVMGMTANTGCNTVYGSTHPSNPHPYPWMNSLFQDGTTIGWLVAESFMQDHARRSVIPERIGRMILDGVTDFTEREYKKLAHFDDSRMTDQEIMELPRVWAVGGDGGIGDIGFQNLSKVILQNRPNISILLLDTQVYSNTGGQNSDSSIMPGGFDMNQHGEWHEGKLTERKEVAQAMTEGHGSPHVSMVSMANSAKFFKSVIDGLCYRGTSLVQAFTSCQPEHGIGDDLSFEQAKRIRDTRGVPEFVFDPDLGETVVEALSLQGNPQLNNDWAKKKDGDGNFYDYSIPHWAYTEGRFRKHFYKIKDESEKLVHFEDLILRVTQQDIVHRRYLDPKHRSYIPTKGVWMEVVKPDGKRVEVGLSRHMVLFSVERRKNWRKLQSRAGLKNEDYLKQKELIAAFEKGEIEPEKFFGNTRALL